MTNAEIAKACGVTRAGLALWQQVPAFQERITRHIEEYRERIVAEGIANRQNRINALNDRWHRMRTVIDERSDELDGRVAGGGTGLLARQIKLSTTGVQVEEFVVDTGLLREMRETEKQAAQELGQWTEKTDLSTGGQPLRFTVQIGPVTSDDSNDTYALESGE